MRQTFSAAEFPSDSSLTYQRSEWRSPIPDANGLASNQICVSMMDPDEVGIKPGKRRLVLE